MPMAPLRQEPINASELGTVVVNARFDSPNPVAFAPFEFTGCQV
jgi:hypothetical protein